jgi:peptide/nickel transport system ATP-binding protein/oligopeptide transport system ATP-binding protein
VEHSLIEVEGIRKLFAIRGGPLNSRTLGHVRAVDDVSFTINPGETFALVGESGCGKTTTARIILRLHTPDEGRVLLDGRDIHQLEGDDLKAFRMAVQAVFQDPWASLNPRMRAGTLVAEALVSNRSLPKKEVETRVAALLERMGFPAWKAELFPHEFSGGQRQRIALASALITDPKLIVLDEPVSALDLSVQAQVINLLKDIQEESRTAFLLIAHDLDTVRYVADRVGVMYLGQLVEETDADVLFSDPKHPYTQALLDSRLPLHPADRKAELRVMGEAPSPMDPPTGCRFRTRCPFAMEVCSEVPARVTVGDGHAVACHLFAP